MHLVGTKSEQPVLFPYPKIKMNTKKQLKLHRGRTRD